MEAPPEDLRRLLAAHEFEYEDSCEEALCLISARLASADLTFNKNVESAAEALASIEAWLGLMSYAVANTYAPSSRMSFAGWRRSVPARLRSMANRFRAPLQKVVAEVAGVQGFSIGVNFPWGVQLSLNWGRSTQEVNAA